LTSIISATDGRIFDSRTFGYQNVAKPDGFNSVKFRQLLIKYPEEQGNATHPLTGPHSIIVGGYCAVSAVNTDMFAVTCIINASCKLTITSQATYGTEKEDFATSVDLMGFRVPNQAVENWKYVMCGGTRENGVVGNNDLNGIIVIMDNNLNRLADYRADRLLEGNDCYNSVKFIGDNINFWCQGFIVAGYRTNIINNQPLKARTLTRFNHNLVKQILVEYTHKTSGSIDEESEGMDVVYVANGFPPIPTNDIAVCGSDPIPSNHRLYAPYNPNDPTTENWLTYSPAKYFDFVLVGWRRESNSLLRVPIITRVDAELNMYDNLTPPGPMGIYSQIYNQEIGKGFNTHSAIFKSVAKVDESGAGEGTW